LPDKTAISITRDETTETITVIRKFMSSSAFSTVVERGGEREREKDNCYLRRHVRHRCTGRLARIIRAGPPRLSRDVAHCIRRRIEVKRRGGRGICLKTLSVPVQPAASLGLGKLQLKGRRRRPRRAVVTNSLRAVENKAKNRANRLFPAGFSSSDILAIGHFSRVTG